MLSSKLCGQLFKMRVIQVNVPFTNVPGEDLVDEFYKTFKLKLVEHARKVSTYD